MSRRKSLSEKEVRTVLAIIESYREQNHYRWDEMNTHMGSLTIEEMIALDSKLKKWYNPEKYDRDPEEEEWDYGEDYSSNAPCDTYGMCAGTSCSHYYECHK